MQHTNSQRGSDGKFSQSDSPKAKRVEVWLQPQTVELLDTLTKQWGVGRGKVIDQLLTRGPVPPQSWTEVTESPPTPSAPPEPEPAAPSEPSPVDFVSDWGVLPPNASKRQWIAVNITLNADLSRSGYGVENFLDQTLRTVAAIRKEGVSIGKACNPGAMPQFRFLMNVETAKPFTAGYDIPAVAIEMAVKFVNEIYPKTKPEPTPSAPPEPSRPEPRFKVGDLIAKGEGMEGFPVRRRRFSGGHWMYERDQPFPVGFEREDEFIAAPPPEPTPSGQSTVFDDPAFIAMQEKMSRQWDICKSDAKVIGCKPERVQRFKAQRKLPKDQPLSVDAQQLLRDELENEQRSAKGEATALDARLVRLRQRATPERLAAMHRGIGQPDICGSSTPDHQSAREYLSRGLELVGLKPQVKITPKLVKTLQALVPSAAHLPLSTTLKVSEAILWGAVLRLCNLESEPPTTSGQAFLDWCQFTTTDKSHRQRQRDQFNLADLMSGQIPAGEARTVLDLPQGIELTKKAISDAYKSKAKQHHPDAGGDASKFQRINEAKDRLMLEVAA